MAITTLEGPVRSLNGFYTQGPNTVVNLANGTNTITLDVATYAGRIIRTNDATLVITLPAVNVTASPVSAGPGTDPNTQNNQGAQFVIFVETSATAVTIRTNGSTSDVFVGSLTVVGAAGASATFAPGATNDFINMDGSTKGGLAGSYIVITSLTTNKWLVQGVLLGSGSAATPFADS
jgi:hypothetical protein